MRSCKACGRDTTELEYCIDCQYLTTRDVARLFKVHRDTVEVWRARKLIKAVKVSRKILIPRESIDALLQPSKGQ